MEGLVRVKALEDYYDDVHYRRREGADTTLCGLKTRGSPVANEVTCLRCRDFASGDF